MGRFGKRDQTSNNQGEQASDEVLLGDDVNVARVAELMERFNEAVPNFSRIHAIGGDLCKIAGVFSFEQSLMMPDGLTQPWRTLASVTYRASQRGEQVLVGRVWGFTYYWNRSIAPQLDRADLVDVPISGCPSDIAAYIAAVGLFSLSQVPASLVLLGNDTGALDAGTLIQAAASTLVDAAEKGIAVDAPSLVKAKSILGRP